jgi:hypothetical protein
MVKIKQAIFAILDFVFKNKYHTALFLGIFLIAVSLMFFKNLIVLIFILIGALSLIHTLITRNYFGFELCTLLAITTAMKFGPVTGAIVGTTSITLGLILGRSIDAGIIASILGFIIIAVVASFFNFSQIIFVGVILTIVYDILLGTFYYFSGSNLFTILMFSISHILLNFFVFTYLSPFFINLVI